MVSKRKKVAKLNEDYINEQNQLLRQNQKRRKGLYRRLTLLSALFVLLCTFAFVTIFSQHMRIKDRQDEIIVLGKEKKQVLTEEKRLLKEIDNYEDDAFIAEIARRDYLFMFPGETRLNVSKKSDD